MEDHDEAKPAWAAQCSVSERPGLGAELSAGSMSEAQGLVLKLEPKQKGEKHPEYTHVCINV